MFKYVCVSFILYALLFLIFNYINVELVNNELELLGKVIYIDPGHGGDDPGAIYGSVKEDKINLEISIMLNDILTSSGAIVYMTRDSDYDLAKPNYILRKKSDLLNRSRLIDNSSSDMYISIHLNATPNTSWHGAQVFYDDINPNNIVLAKIIQDQFRKDLDSTRKVKEIRELYMYKNTYTLGVLVEVGFLSNPNERHLLQTKSYQKKICESLKKSIINYYKGL